jgi:hypothetical protein
MMVILADVGLYSAFYGALMPVLQDIGKIMFMTSTVYGTYYIMRMKYGEGANMIKYAAIGYICLSLTDKFIRLVDKIVANMKF